ncbi:IclR family transcriptional regulator [Desulforamulus putei]|uniref:Glycerol operon regulatory protein n=1 Tax=Desulforamulus putei DSM 12395 TaxID=1121429 RepID=A0A1M5BZH1_9FIRM|nr:IclR family transcriptional regulator [Desulforamulus putei]SHF47934.1 transcriptional regulator, IclR family [Desulforamulus putei DSM 12395]
MKSERDNVVQSLDRALDILEELSRHESGLGVTEIGSIVGLHKSTVHRLLHTLMLRGYVEKKNDTEKYRLGLKLISLGQARLDSMEIRSEARPFLQELMEQTQEAVHLCLWENGKVVYIDKVESRNSVLMYSRIGRVAPIHCTGVGKVIAAFQPEAEVIKIIKESGLVYKTDKTITQLDKLLKHFEEIRRQGYAIDDEEHDPGLRCVAAPVRDYKGNVIASISVAGPTIRVTKDRIEKELATMLIETANKISRQLGYRQ